MNWNFLRIFRVDEDTFKAVWVAENPHPDFHETHSVNKRFMAWAQNVKSISPLFATNCAVAKVLRFDGHHHLLRAAHNRA
jgi:hypothetical protein